VRWKSEEEKRRDETRQEDEGKEEKLMKDEGKKEMKMRRKERGREGCQERDGVQRREKEKEKKKRKRGRMLVGKEKKRNALEIKRYTRREIEEVDTDRV
jgi:hypothetical protein